MACATDFNIDPNSFFKFHYECSKALGKKQNKTKDKTTISAILDLRRVQACVLMLSTVELETVAIIKKLTALMFIIIFILSYQINRSLQIKVISLLTESVWD